MHLNRSGGIRAAQLSPVPLNLEIRRTPAESERRNVSIVFVHGIYHGAWAFSENLVPYFAARGYDCISFSWRGHGESEGREEIKNWSFDDYVSDLRQVLETIQGNVILIGHSAGTGIIQRHLESETALAAVMISPTMSEALRETRVQFLLKYPMPILKMAITGDPDHLYHRHEDVREFLFDGDKSELTEKALEKLSTQPESGRMMKQLFELEFRAPEKPIPTLFIRGDHDSTVPPATLETLRRKYGGEVLNFPNGAHELFLMPGWERVAQGIDEWLEKLI